MATAKSLLVRSGFGRRARIAGLPTARLPADDRRRRAEGVALVAASAACFGAMAIFARIAYDSGADVAAVLWLRFTMAGILMFALMARRRRVWPKGRDLATLAALGGVGYVGQSLSFFTALTLASASVVSLLLYLFPAIVTVLAAVFLGQRISLLTGAALVLALAGSALVVGPSGDAEPLGIVLGVAAALIYAVYIVAGSQVTPRAGAVPSSAVIVLAAGAVYTAVAAVVRPDLPGTAGGWLAVAAIAAVSTVGAIVTFFAGLARLGPTDASTLSTLEPVVTVVLAAVVLDERIGALQVAGGVLVLAAVIVLSRRRAGPDLAPEHAAPV